MKRYSASLDVRRKPIKTTVRCHFILPGCLESKSQATRSGENVEKLKPFIYCWWECKIMQVLWKPLWQCLEGLNREVTIWYDNSSPWYILKRNKNVYPPKTCTWIFITRLFIRVKREKQPKCLSVDKWVS